MSEEQLAYEVSVNGGDPLVAGSAELDVLSAMLTAVRERGGADLSIAGLVVRPDGQHEHWRWLSQPLGVGDEISIRVVSESDCVAPISRETVDPAAPPSSEE